MSEKQKKCGIDPDFEPGTYDWMAIAVLSGIVVVLALLFLGPAQGECLHSAAAVHQTHGQHALWSRQIKGHEGEKCYYAAGWRNREVKAEIPLPQPRQEIEQPQISQPLSPMKEEPPEFHQAMASYLSPMTMLIDEHATPFSADGLVAGRLEVAGWRLWLAESVERADRARARLVRSFLSRAGAWGSSF